LKKKGIMNLLWLDRKEYPFKSRNAEINGQQMHYIDEGDGPVIVFVHGTPSWSFDFRNVIKALSKSHRCIAADHIGFGLSSKPANYPYSTQQHAENFEVFIRNLGLSTFTLVVHDFGGPIGLNYALKFPEEVRKLVIMNSWLWSNTGDPDFIKFSKILKNPLLPFLYLYMNFSARFLLPNSFGSKKLVKSILKHYTKPFASKKERNGTLGFARSLLSAQGWFEELWSLRNKISSKPALFIWGMQDKFITPKYLEKFESEFTNSITIRLENVGHFPQEEEPINVSLAIKNFHDS
jgi:haloalkane dehalogenase